MITESYAPEDFFQTDIVSIVEDGKPKIFVVEYQLSCSYVDFVIIPLVED